jgi:hypothetical protein
MAASDLVPEKEQALRYNNGKAQWSLVDFKSLEPLVDVLEYGAKKYERNNWKKGLPVNENCESLMRHVIAFMDGENTDSESGCSHLGHIMANAMFLSWILENKPEFDNRNEKNTIKKNIEQEVRREKISDIQIG